MRILKTLFKRKRKKELEIYAPTGYHAYWFGHICIVARTSRESRRTMEKILTAKEKKV